MANRNVKNLILFSKKKNPILQIPNLRGYWSADKITGLVDGAAVSVLVDASGNRNNAVQATATNQPLYKVGIQNNLPALLCDGKSILISSYTVLGAEGTYIALFKPVQGNGGTSANILNSDANVRSRLTLSDSLNTNLVYQKGNPAIRIPTTNTITFGSCYLIIGYGHSAPSIAGSSRVNGVQKATDTTFEDVTNGTYVRLCAFQQNAVIATAQGLDGYFFEAAHFDRELTIGEIQRIERYLMSKYNFS